MCEELLNFDDLVNDWEILNATEDHILANLILNTVVVLQDSKPGYKFDASKLTASWVNNKKAEVAKDRIVYVRHSAGAWVAAFDRRYKLVLSNSDKPWLFDLQKDPDELRNFFGREGYTDVTNRLKKELVSQMKEFKEPALTQGKLRHE